jgi:hypothetical protein
MKNRNGRGLKRIIENPLYWAILLTFIFIVWFLARSTETFTCKTDGSGSVLTEDDMSFNLTGTCSDFKSMLLGATMEEINGLA